MKRRNLLGAVGALCAARPLMAVGKVTSEELDISKAGAIGDDKTLNTQAIQAAIDQLATRGGGTLVVPQGVFVTGALFLKPGVNLHLQKGGVLKCSTDRSNFPQQRTWIEGHYEEAFNPALINASGCDGLKISGEGTLDGAGFPVWEEFWTRRNASGKGSSFKNLDVQRARLAIIDQCKGVTIEGITFKDSQFWNLHIFRCQQVLVQNASFQVPDDYKQAPSSDGIDIDSSQDVRIKGCTFSVTDDCIALKGAKGPLAQDLKLPPTERVHVSDCWFKRGHAAVNFGSEATLIRNILVENCRVTGGMGVLALKLRSDTAQVYENVEYRNLTLDGSEGLLVNVYPWKQYTDLKGQPPPQSNVRNIKLSNIKGRYGSFGTISGNPGQTTISGILIENVNVQFTNSAKLEAEAGVTGLVLKNVTANGKPVTAAAKLGKAGEEFHPSK